MNTDAAEFAAWLPTATSTPQRPDAGGGRTTPVPKRRYSNASEKSSNSVNTNVTFIYDSGNYSTSSNASDTDHELQSNHERFQHMLREKDQALFLALQDVRRLRSELERLGKSEQWYKQELRTQKSTRLEALERLYAQERKYMQENQRLQRECVRLYERCAEMEQELSTQQEKALQQLARETDASAGERAQSVHATSLFEIEQQRAIIDDQQQLIVVLRKQKRALLEDLQRLTEEKDEKVLELQRTVAAMDLENTHMTAQCKRLLTERHELEQSVKEKVDSLEEQNAQKQKLQVKLEELQEQLAIETQMLVIKEKEITDLQQQFKANMQQECNMDEVHRLSLSYHEQLNAKTAEIVSLKKTLHTLQSELGTVQDLQTQTEQQERMIESLNATLDTKQYELAQLKQTNEEKAQQILELQQSVEKLHGERSSAQAHLQSTQQTLKGVEKELIALNEQYASMCALCEQTRFELDMREIEQGRLNFEAVSDRQEIEQLRAKLSEYLKQTEELSKKIEELEEELQRAKEGKRNLEGRLKEVEKRLRATKKDKDIAEESLENVAAERVTISHYLKKIEELELSLHMNEAIIEQLQAENLKLKEDEGNKKKEELLAMTEDEEESGFLDDDQSESSRQLKNKESIDSKELTALQTELQTLLNEQVQCFYEKAQMFQALESLTDSGSNIKDPTAPAVMEKLVNEHKKLKAQQNDECQQLHKQLEKQTQTCEELTKKLTVQQSELQLVQRTLLISDGKLYKAEKAIKEMQDNLKQDVLQQAALEALKKEHEKVKHEMEEGVKLRHHLEHALEQETEATRALKKRLFELENKQQKKLVEQSTQTLTIEEQETTPIEAPSEVKALKEKVKQLETLLQAQSNANNAGREQRIAHIKQLLDQQNEKMSKLNDSQAEWEEMLAALEQAQRMNEDTRHELATKTAELDELNELFDEQNEELRQLHEMGLFTDHKRQAETEELKSTFQQQMNVLQATYSDKIKECEVYQSTIAELRSENACLERKLNEDYASEVAENQKQLRALQVKVEKLQAERESYAIRLGDMEMELDELRKSKRHAMLLPELVLCKQDETESGSDDSPRSVEEEQPVCEDQLRILTKVLEAEYRRKMKRYDLHIRTLLNNVKSLKRALKAAEQRVAQLSETQARSVEKAEDLQLTKCRLEEMRLKFEQSQDTIKALEEALNMERRKFSLSDTGKSVYNAREEPIHEVPNLIDDYKKLIKQSAVSTRRPKTSHVLELIQRSNQYVPNLNKLESNINGLRNDVDCFLAKYTQQLGAEAKPVKMPSLLDELRAATNSF